MKPKDIENIERNIKTIPILLRAIANGTEAKANKHDVIFNEAADLIEFLANSDQPRPSKYKN